MTWSVLVIADSKARAAGIADALKGSDGKVNVCRVVGVQRALDSLQRSPPVLAAISLGGNPTDTLVAVDALHRRAPGLDLLVEVPADLPLVPLQAMASGATDCLKRPVAPWEWQNRTRALLTGIQQRCLLTAALRRHALGRLQQEPVADLSDQFLSILTSAGCQHDAVTGRHEQRTGRLAGCIADSLGLPDAESKMIAEAATLHDIGKLGIRDTVLRKPGRYTDVDRTIMGRHPLIGHEILRRGSTPVLMMAADMALGHHERVDGGGYPRGLRGDEIPLTARIAAVADVFDAVTTGRPYRPAVAVDEAFDFIRQGRGTHFDSDCVDALFACRVEASAIVGT